MRAKHQSPWQHHGKAKKKQAPIRLPPEMRNDELAMIERFLAQRTATACPSAVPEVDAGRRPTALYHVDPNELITWAPQPSWRE